MPTHFPKIDTGFFGVDVKFTQQHVREYIATILCFAIKERTRNVDAQRFVRIRSVKQDKVDAEVFRLRGSSSRLLNVDTSAQTANRRRFRACLGDHCATQRKRELSRDRD